MHDGHAEEPEYQRALAHALVVRAEIEQRRFGTLDPTLLEEAVALIDIWRADRPGSPGESRKLRISAREQGPCVRRRTMRPRRYTTFFALTADRAARRFVFAPCFAQSRMRKSDRVAVLSRRVACQACTGSQREGR